MARDIVERLRAYALESDQDVMILRTADEIERLHDENEQLRAALAAAVSDAIWNARGAARIEELEAENRALLERHRSGIAAAVAAERKALIGIAEADCWREGNEDYQRGRQDERRTIAKAMRAWKGE